MVKDRARRIYSINEVDPCILILDEQLGGLDFRDWNVVPNLDDFGAAVGPDYDSSLGLGDGRHGSIAVLVECFACN